jgi:hypothetical protein
MQVRLPSILTRQRPVLLGKTELLEKAINVARRPEDTQLLLPGEREQVEQVVKALQVGSGGAALSGRRSLQQRANQRPVSASVLAARAHQILGPSSNITPVDIALAMQEQGLTMVEPFGPGQPLQPYYGYSRQPRTFDYRIARNTTTETREDRIPNQTLLQMWKSYDIAQSCTRYSINDLRSMRIRLEAMDGYEENPTKELAAARKFMRRLGGTRGSLRSWLASNQRNLWIYDAAPVFRQRDRAGRLKSLKNFSAQTLAPMLDYYGEIPTGDAPAYEQFIEGVPWNWLKDRDVIWEPFWPETDSPYGTPPLETCLLNANTDMRLQLYFLQFFTAGSVPEAFAIAPEDMTSGDDIAEFEEQYYDYFQGDQSNRWGLHWLPNGTDLHFYKPQMFDPDLAEYVERRTIAAFGLTPQNLGLTADVNRASSETQVDQQFRITTLPITLYYEDVFDAVLQEDLDLPVQVRFDTGREKEDRLMEAEAHQIYWQIGAEGSDEIREKVLGLPVNNEERVPRAIYDQRLGIIPLAHVIAISGDVDTLTGAPRPGTVERIPFQLPGGPGANPGQGQETPPPETTDAGHSGTQYDDNASSDRRRGAGPSGARPKAAPKKAKADPTKSYPEPPYPVPRNVASKGLTPGATFGDSSPYPEIASGSTMEAPGYGVFPGGSTAQGTATGPTETDYGTGGGPDPKHTTYAIEKDGATAGITSATGVAGVDGGGHDGDDEERADLVRWLRRAKKSVEAGRTPGQFSSSAIRSAVYAAVSVQLEKATTLRDVDRAFDIAFKAHATAAAPKKVGLALVAEDTGRVVMVQRGNKHG